MTTTVDPPVDTPEPGPRPRRSRTATVAAVVVAVILAGLVWILATNPNAGERRDSASLVGHPAPQIEARTLDGGRFDSEAGRGRRFLLVNFFATWCVPCRQEHPELVKFAERHEAAADADVVSVAFDRNNEADLHEFFEKQGGDWPLLQDLDGRIALDYGVTGIPESYLVSPSGLVIAKFKGVTADGVDDIIAEYTGTSAQ